MSDKRVSEEKKRKIIDAGIDFRERAAEAEGEEIFELSQKLHLAEDTVRNIWFEGL